MLTAVLKATHLTCLDIDIQEPPKFTGQHDALGFFKVAHFPKLRVLRLRDGRLNSEDAWGFLSRHSESLRELGLINFSLLDSNHLGIVEVWSAFLHRIKNELSLQRAGITLHERNSYLDALAGSLNATVKRTESSNWMGRFVLGEFSCGCSTCEEHSRCTEITSNANAQEPTWIEDAIIAREDVMSELWMSWLGWDCERRSVGI